jgi:hypothetical protein
MVSVLAWSGGDCGFIGGVMVSVLAWSGGDCGFKNAAFRSKSKDWLAQNQDKVSEWSDMSTYGLLF